MDIKEVERIVGDIQAKLFRNSNSQSVGMLKSRFRGSGLQFKEHQVYVPGDEVRFIDWKLFAKSSTPYVKTFEEERNVEIDVVIDWSPSMLMGENRRSKLQAALEISALLLLLSKKSNDKVSFIFASNDFLRLPPKSGKEGLVGMVSLLEKIGLLNAKGQVDLDYTRPVMPRREFIISMKSLLAKKKEVIYLGDFANFAEMKDFISITSMPNFHCFKMKTSLETNKNSRYTISTTDRRSVYIRPDLETVKLKGRWKEIDVGKSYLETFVKEMI